MKKEGQGSSSHLNAGGLLTCGTGRPWAWQAVPALGALKQMRQILVLRGRALGQVQVHLQGREEPWARVLGKKRGRTTLEDVEEWVTMKNGNGVKARVRQGGSGRASLWAVGRTPSRLLNDKGP